MFDLDQEVQAWCRSIHTHGTDREERIAELADHLLCDVDRLMSAGYTEEQAFRTAVRQMGEPDDLAREHSKVLTGMSKYRAVFVALFLCRARALDLLLTGKERAQLIIVVALVFAAAILTTSWLLRGSENAQQWTFIWVALWWIPNSVLSVVKPCGERKECGEVG